MNAKPKTRKVTLLMLLFLGLLSIGLVAQESGFNIEVKKMDGYKALVLKADIPTSQIGEKMGEMYGKLFSYIQDQNIETAGPTFAVYYSFDPNGNTSFEVGVPVKSKVNGNGEVQFKEYPPTKAVTAMYMGSYDKMEPVYQALEKYIQDNNLKKEGTSWEVYYTDPNEVKPEDNQTLVYFPIKE